MHYVVRGISNMSDDKLTVEQQATNFHTMKHIQTVSRILHRVVMELLKRADTHDESKLHSPEVELFTEYTARLATSTYGSPEYNEFRKQMKPALDHHYAHNPHHPEYHKNGINDMTLVDLVEMLADWKGASLRHNNGNIRRSIEINAGRFDISPQLAKILENTVRLFDDIQEG